MGKCEVTTPLTITNYADQIAPERGHRQTGAVRSVTLDAVLVDTGAIALALPADVIAQLGLTLREEVPILTAAGPATAPLYRDAALILPDREGTFDCLELPDREGTFDCLELPVGTLSCWASFR